MTGNLKDDDYEMTSKLTMKRLTDNSTSTPGYWFTCCLHEKNTIHNIKFNTWHQSLSAADYSC